MTLLVVIAGLVLLVFLHELGHFWVARAVGMRPRSFYIGFPPALFKVRRKGIDYGIGMIPLGGMVQLPGMNRPAARDLRLFLERRLAFLEIADVVGDALARADGAPARDLADLVEADRAARTILVA